MGWTAEQLERWIDRHAVDREGYRVGTIADVYIDDATGEPEWLALMTGLFGSRISFVPLAGADEDGSDIRIAHLKSTVKDSPNIEADGELTEEEEERLYRHYGLPYGVQMNTTVIADVDPEHQAEGSASLTTVPSVEIARNRLRRRDAEAIDNIDLTSDEIVGDTKSADSKRS